MYTVPTINEILGLTAIAKQSTPDNVLSVLWLYLGDFLDYFYAKERTTHERQQLVIVEPNAHAGITETTYAFIAGAVHKICTDYDVPVPKWTFKQKYFLQDPYFSMNAKGMLRLSLLAESPLQFRARHIYTSANTLSRV